MTRCMNRTSGTSAVRSSFQSAMDGFVALVATVPPGQLDRAGLGTWSVRDLIGHASRALSTIESYMGQTSDGAHLEGPAAYFAAAGAAPPGSAARAERDASITERAKESGEALGDDPGAAVRALAAHVAALVDASEDDTPMATALGQMTLSTYLPTRTFELVVHSLDVARALDLEVPEALGSGIAASVVLAGEIAARHPAAPQVLLALCGRRGLPEAFSVV